MFVRSNSNKNIPYKRTYLSKNRCIPQNVSHQVPQKVSPHAEQHPQSYTIANTEAFCGSYSQLENDVGNDIGLSLGDVSMTFLSQSLK